MKLINVISKSLKEQVRSYWVLLLTLSMGPFFIFIYYLITESSSPQYTVLVVNNDPGVQTDGQRINYGNEFIAYFNSSIADIIAVPYNVEAETVESKGIEKVKSNEADALIIIDGSFSQAIENHKSGDITIIPKVEFIGDLTSTSYMMSAVWANEILNEYVLKATNQARVITVKETALGRSGVTDEFNMMVPGLLIVSLIMLMFTASIAFVSEVENKTIMRLKLSKLTTMEFLGGVGFVQLMVGVLSVLLTLLTAISLGFQFSGSLAIVILIASLTSLSIIAFSLIIAAATKSAGEVLVVGNFPMFLFMFFTGAAFPLKSRTLFMVAGYPVNIQGLMTPTHAVSALNKTLIMEMNLKAVIPEIVLIILLTILYFIIGSLIFRNRHLKLT